jgi:hypothetical protein
VKSFKKGMAEEDEDTSSRPKPRIEAQSAAQPAYDRDADRVRELLPTHASPAATLATMIALTGCDFCNSMPVIGPAKLWAARHLFRNIDVCTEAGALAAISHAYTKNFAGRVGTTNPSDITASSSSSERALDVYHSTAAHIQCNFDISAQTRDRIWSATHMRNHVRNAMWTVLEYWSRLDQYSDPTLADHGYHKDSRGVCHFKMDE